MSMFAHMLNIYVHLCVCINIYKYMQIWFYSFLKSCTVWPESSSKALSKVHAFEVRKRMVLPGSVLKWKWERANFLHNSRHNQRPINIVQERQRRQKHAFMWNWSCLRVSLLKSLTYSSSTKKMRESDKPIFFFSSSVTKIFFKLILLRGSHLTLEQKMLFVTLALYSKAWKHTDKPTLLEKMSIIIVVHHPSFQAKGQPFKGRTIISQ